MDVDSTADRKYQFHHKKHLLFGYNIFGKGLFFAHTGSIIVGSSIVGDNCILHGDNTISSKAVIGDNCELWVGARIMDKGNIKDGTIVGGGSVVISDFSEPNIIIAGVPAKKIKHKETSE